MGAEGTADALGDWRRINAVEPVSGRWSVAGGSILGATDSGDVFARTGQVASDFSIEADVTLTEGKRAAALVFRASPSMESLYALTLDHAVQVVRLFKWPSPVVIRDVPFELRPGVAYRVRVAAVGPRITAAVNGKPLVDIVDSTHAEGRIGLNVFGLGGPAKATFANVRFRNDDSPESQVQRTEALLGHVRSLRDRLAADRHRPRYHFLPPAAWMNDPNGAIFWKGRYHVFYQYNPDGAYWKWIQWGHASSPDLVHWVHHPIALAPTPGGPDREGCFSGGAVVVDGVPTLIYHGVPDGTCLATSRDDLLLHWTKHPANPVITPTKVRGDFAVYDPCAWRRGDAWYALCGRVDPAGGDTAFLFRSKDMVHWEYLHPFYKSDRRWTDADEDCAVPDFFPLADKHLLLFASHKRGGQYYIGRYANDRFVPERHGRLNWPGGSLIAPISTRDGKGRRILFAWVNEQYRERGSRIAGWAGTLTLPRLLSLDGSGRLLFEPAPELAVLRMERRQVPDATVAADGETTLSGIEGDSLEISLEMQSENASQFGLKARCSPDGAEQTAVAFCPQEKALKVDVHRASLDPDAVPLAFPTADRSVRVQSAPLELGAGEPLRLRLFLDRSILEVYANGRQCVTQRIYPSRTDSMQLRLFSRGGPATASRIEAWPMGPAHD